MCVFLLRLHWMHLKLCVSFALRKNYRYLRYWWLEASLQEARSPLAGLRVIRTYIFQKITVITNVTYNEKHRCDCQIKQIKHRTWIWQRRYRHRINWIIDLSEIFTTASNLFWVENILHLGYQHKSYNVVYTQLMYFGIWNQLFW